MNKNELRKLILKKRKDFSEGKCLHIDNLINERVKQFLSLTFSMMNISNIAFYIGANKEADLYSSMSFAKKEGKNILLPVVQKKDSPMIFREWNLNYNSLVSSKVFKEIKEPDYDLPEMEPDIIIIPCVAINKKGYRVGYGGGYYDRTLEELKKKNSNLKTISICANEFIVEYDFQTENDMKSDCLITEKQIIST